MTSWQKGNESEQEMEALGAFLELAQAIPTQTVMTTPAWQSVDLGWKPLETEKLHLDSSIRDIRDERGEKNVTSQMDGCVCKFIKQPLKKKIVTVLAYITKGKMILHQCASVMQKDIAI